MIRGRHTIKLDSELDRQFRHDTTWGDSSSGDFNFTGVGTNSGTSLDPRAGNSTSPGIPFADFLLGNVGTWNIFNGTPTNIATWISGSFVNDDFKLTSRLTLNLGIRYQHQTGWAVADNAFGNFDPNLPNPGSFPPGALGALRFGGVNGHNTIEPSVKLPSGWKFASALETASQSGDEVTFKPVSFENLVDSPLMTGILPTYFRRSLS